MLLVFGAFPGLELPLFFPLRFTLLGAGAVAVAADEEGPFFFICHLLMDDGQ